MSEKSKSIKISALLKNKSMFILTSIIYFLIVVLYETLYCNFEFFSKVIPNYNFSLYRIVAYLTIYLVFYKFKDKLIERALDAFESKVKCFVADILLIFTVMLFILTIITSIMTTINITTVILLISSLIFDLLVIYISNNILQNAVVTALLVGTIFSNTITFNNQLDEKRHFLSSYSVALGNFNMKNASIDESVANMSNQINVKNFIKYFNTYPTNEITKDFSDKDIQNIPNDYLSISYLISGLGVFIAKVLGGSIADVYIAGRIFNLLGCIFFMVLALKTLPYKKNILYVIFFMPMLLALASVYSIDGIGTAIVALFIAYCLKLHEKEAINIKEVCILIGLLMLAAFIKSVGYIAISLIVLILPLKKIIKQNKKYIKYIAIFFAIVLAVIALTYIARINEPGDPRSKGTNTSVQFDYILHTPLKYFSVLVNHTIFTFTSLKCMSFLNAPMFFYSTYYYSFIALGIYLLFISITDNTKQLKCKTRLIFAFTFFVVFAMVSTAMYLSYTMVGANYIDGFQMRYLFPILFLLLSSISIKKCSLKNNFKFNNIYISYISLIFLMISVIDAIA